jgi:hypothetical protein
VDVESLTSLDPVLHGGMLVGCVVINDQVDLLVFRRQLVDDSQKAQPFLVTMSVVAQSDYATTQSVESGE